MDIKPTRPRARVYADENAAPSNLQPKTLHSRHKSQPILKAVLASNGPQKLGVRRAFGDVSNVATNVILRDDSVGNASKTTEKDMILLKGAEKSIAVITKESALNTNTVLRPAASSIALRSNFGTQPSTTKVASATEKARIESSRSLRKSKTTVFREKAAPKLRPTSIQQDLAIPDDIIEENQPHRDVEAPIAKESAEAIPLVAEAAPIALEAESLAVNDFQVLSRHEVIPRVVPESEQLQSILPESLQSQAPALEILSNDLPVVEDCSQSAALANFEQYESALEVMPDAIVAEDPCLSIPLPAEDILDEHIPLPVAVDLQGPNSATIPEPEEYWDVEEDDAYHDDGYVTARSFKSIGESQVSVNLTRTLYPHVDQAVRRELAAARALVESSLDPAEVEDEAWDTSMVQEYGEEIFEYMRELEVRMSPNPHYMDKQTEIQWSMRSVLMDWIVQVHHRFGMLPETLFLCINLIDRFLSQKIVSLTKLQLVGATAIFVAAKYEEVDCPSVDEINFMVDNGYGVEEILKAERFMLSMLRFELGFPGPMSFLRRISKADDYDLETRTLAKYFLEITIMDERFLPCVPSFTAAGAHCLARMTLHKGNWSPAHVHYSGYTYSQLLPLISLMLECCEDPVGHHNAVYEKYLDRRYKQAAKYVQGELNNGFRVPNENVNMPSPFFTPPQQHYHAVPPHYPPYWSQVA